MIDYSVAIPAYAPAAVVRDTIRSALEQRYPAGMRWEVLVNDDAWQPPLAPQLAEFGEAVRFYCNDCNLGYAKNFLRTVELARGRWVHVLHSDDLVHPMYAAQVWELVQKDPGLGFIHSGLGSIGRPNRFLSFIGGRILGSKRPEQSPNKDGVQLFEAGLVGARQALRHGVKAPTLVVRRDLALALGGYAEDLDVVADEEFVVRLALAARQAYIPQAMVFYRRRPDQTSRQSWLRDDFVDLYWKCHMRNLEHLGAAAEPEDREAAHRRVAGGAVVSAFAFFLKGNQERAIITLKRAYSLWPKISENRTYRLLAMLIKNPWLGWFYRFASKRGWL